MTPDNCIKIVVGKGMYRISSTHQFFQCDEVVITYRSSILTIKRPTIDYRGKIHTVSKVRNTDKKYRLFHIPLYYDLPLGIFDIDLEESNEDKLTIYLT